MPPPRTLCPHIARALLLLLLPLGEFLLARYFLHSILKLQIGWGSLMIDADMLPFIPAFVIYFAIASYQNQIKFSLQRPGLLLHCLLAAVWVLINLNYSALSSASIFGYFWWTATLLFFASSFFLFLPPQAYFLKANRLVFLPCLLIAVSLILTKHFFLSGWLQMMDGLAIFGCPVIEKLIGEAVTCRIVVPRDPMLRISSHAFAALIGKPCGGLDGMLFMLNLSFLIWIFRGKALGLGVWALNTAVGLVLFLGLNLLRLALLYSAGVWLYRHFGNRFAAQAFETIFHAHLGWILYVGFAVIYFYVTLEFVPRFLSYANKVILAISRRPTSVG